MFHCFREYVRQPQVIQAYVTEKDYGKIDAKALENFTTQEKFADIDSINRERIRKAQTDMLKMLKHTEDEIARTKRDITKYLK